jgi:hypothetical protein
LYPSGPASTVMIAQGMRRREVLRRTLSLEILEQMGHGLLTRWRAVLLSLNRDRERLRRFVRAVNVNGRLRGALSSTDLNNPASS